MNLNNELMEKIDEIENNKELKTIDKEIKKKNIFNQYMPLINSNLDKINNYGKLQPERCIDVGIVLIKNI